MTSSPSELGYCAGLRLKQADGEMTVALDRAAAKIGSASAMTADEREKWKLALDASQKAWSTFREADCKGAVSFEWQGSTGAQIAQLECMAQMTEQRVFDLGERYGNR